jgi:hypothetical protein
MTDGMFCELVGPRGPRINLTLKKAPGVIISIGDDEDYHGRLPKEIVVEVTPEVAARLRDRLTELLDDLEA